MSETPEEVLEAVLESIRAVEKGDLATRDEVREAFQATKGDERV